ncbi:MAG TPA: dienelactone hydrolase family protein [Gemmatimonadaceae bacterium]|jgi:dienelactone hydrolase
MHTSESIQATARPVRIAIDGVMLDGDLVVPPQARGIVIFAHGSGSSRQSPRNRFVARELGRSSFATLLLDLLTRDEEGVDAATGELRFDIPFLADRLGAATDWVVTAPGLRSLPVGYFGASTGAAAALVAASHRRGEVRAIVSRGGRPDLAGDALRRVHCPVMLIVGAADPEVLELNRDALVQLGGPRALELVPRATHLFEEPGALEEVARLARGWFEQYLSSPRTVDSRDAW